MKKSISHLISVLVAVLASQIILGSLIIAVQTAMSGRIQNSPWFSILVMAPSVTGFLLGGLFIGRIERDRPALWISAAMLNSVIFILDDLFSGDFSFSWISDPHAWINMGGSIAVWLFGSFIGKVSNTWKPEDHFNHSLKKYVSIGVLCIIGLNLTSWAAIYFSKWNRIARTIDLAVPASAEELSFGSHSPFVARQRVFEMTVHAGSTEIFDFYATQFKSPAFEDVSEKLGGRIGGIWQLKEASDETGHQPVQHTAAHWRDLSGEVLISMFCRAERIDPLQDWSASQWRVRAAIVSSQYVEPVVQQTDADAPTEGEP